MEMNSFSTRPSDQTQPTISRQIHSDETGSTKLAYVSGSESVFSVMYRFGCSWAEGHYPHRHGLRAQGWAGVPVPTGVSRGPKRHRSWPLASISAPISALWQMEKKQSPGTFHWQTNRFLCYHNCFSYSVKIGSRDSFACSHVEITK